MKITQKLNRGDKMAFALILALLALSLATGCATPAQRSIAVHIELRADNNSTITTASDFGSPAQSNEGTESQTATPSTTISPTTTVGIPSTASTGGLLETAVKAITKSSECSGNECSGSTCTICDPK